MIRMVNPKLFLLYRFLLYLVMVVYLDAPLMKSIYLNSVQQCVQLRYVSNKCARSNAFGSVSPSIIPLLDQVGQSVRIFNNSCTIDYMTNLVK